LKPPLLANRLRLAAPIGLAIGAKWGFALSTVYIALFAVTVPLINPSPHPPLSQQWNQAMLNWLGLLSIYGCLIGVLPSTALGAFTGAIVAGALAIPRHLPRAQTSVLIAFAICLLLTGAIAFFLYGLPADNDSLFDYYGGLPMAIFLFASVPATLLLHRRLSAAHGQSQLPSSAPAA
jgi:hypothetical protein